MTCLSFAENHKVDKQRVNYIDQELISYKKAWELQESLLSENLEFKMHARNEGLTNSDTKHFLLTCEHPPVFTLGKNGNINNLHYSEQELEENGIEFYKINRGGDITYHGPGQLVGYPILDLEKFYTDIGFYLRNLEEVIIRTLKVFGLESSRSKGETGVWIDPDIPGRERKICAIGIRCSRWVTMHGFALNVNTDLEYFNHIVPCGIKDKQVTSMQNELNRVVDMNEVKKVFLENFAQVFNVDFS